jgi:diguanylate cyclase (GGDEF)-like protein
MIRPMNLSPSTLLIIIVVTTVVNVLILLGVSARSRANRARPFAEVEGMLSSSYVDARSGEGWPESGDGWPGSGGASTPGAPSDDPEETTSVDPFEYPAPSSLEQRSLDLDDVVDESEWVDGSSVEGSSDEDEIQTNGESPAEPESPAAAEPPAEGAEAPLPAGREIAGLRGRDILTGMLDAMAFEEALAHEDAREQRYGRPATVIVFELDGLARLVDRLGSDPGDRIEAALGDTITRLARRADYVARLEPGRYAVFLPETDEVAAINYVERIRRACDLWLESGAIAMKLAIGWASTTGDAKLAGAIRVATERMRVELRRNGRQGGDETVDEEQAGL